MPDEFAKIKLTKKGLEVIGNGVIDCAMTIKTIEALLKLPATGNNSMKSIVDRFSTRTRRAFDSIIKLDERLKEAFSVLAVGHIIDPNDVIEEIFIDLFPVTVILFTSDGRRYVSPETRKYDKLETIEEFENRTGMSVLDSIRKDINSMVEKAKRTISLLESEPIEYLVDVINQAGGGMAAETKRITVYHEEQVYLFAQRHNFSVMNISINQPK